MSSVRTLPAAELASCSRASQCTPVSVPVPAVHASPVLQTRALQQTHPAAELASCSPTSQCTPVSVPVPAVHASPVLQARTFALYACPFRSFNFYHEQLSTPKLAARNEGSQRVNCQHADELPGKHAEKQDAQDITAPCAQAPDSLVLELLEKQQQLFDQIDEATASKEAMQKRVEELGDEVKRLMSEKDEWMQTAEAFKIRNNASVSRVKALEAENANWEEMVRSTAGFSISLCRPNGDSARVERLLPSDTMAALFDRAASEFDIPNAALHVVVGEEAVSLQDKRLHMTLNSHNVSEGDSVTCIYNATPSSFKVGEAVQYWSKSHLVWMSATVLRPKIFDENGLPSTYDLDIKKGASVMHIRAAAAKLDDF